MAVNHGMLWILVCRGINVKSMFELKEMSNYVSVFVHITFNVRIYNVHYIAALCNRKPSSTSYIFIALNKGDRQSMLYRIITK